MAIRVAVLDPLPMFARGLAATLAEDGLSPDSPGDVLPWLEGPGQPAILLTLAEPADWRRLPEIMAVRPDALVIAILRVTDTDTFRRALSSGAVAVLPRDASAALVRQTVRAVLGGRALVPIEILRACWQRGWGSCRSWRISSRSTFGVSPVAIGRALGSRGGD